MPDQPILGDSTAWAICIAAVVIGPGSIASVFLCLAKLGWAF